MRIPLPKKSKYTPVQQFNRDGVAALKKHDISKAKRLFYKAYLIDPNDPFTLNNLDMSLSWKAAWSARNAITTRPKPTLLRL